MSKLHYFLLSIAWCWFYKLFENCIFWWLRKCAVVMIERCRVRWNFALLAGNDPLHSTMLMAMFTLSCSACPNTLSIFVPYSPLLLFLWRWDDLVILLQRQHTTLVQLQVMQQEVPISLHSFCDQMLVFDKLFKPTCLKGMFNYISYFRPLHGQYLHLNFGGCIVCSWLH